MTAHGASVTADARPGRDRYRSYADLAGEQVEGRDYRVRVRRRASPVAIVAPHGGSIERRTSAISSALAGESFNLYQFEGLDERGSFDVLHLTSHRFDEPRCLAMIAGCETVVAVHGCAGTEPAVLLGGRDERLAGRLAAALAPLVGVTVLTRGHRYPGRHRLNVCNRGASGAGVQIELTDALRGGTFERAVVDVLRATLSTQHLETRGAAARAPAHHAYT